MEKYGGQFSKFLLFLVLGAGVLIKYISNPEYLLNPFYIILMGIIFSISLFYGLACIVYLKLYKIIKKGIDRATNEFVGSKSKNFNKKIDKRARTFIQAEFLNIAERIGHLINIFVNLIYLIVVPYKVVKNAITYVIQKRNLKSEFPYYLLITTLIILFISIFVVFLSIYKFFGILSYFEKSDLIYSFLNNNMETPTLTGVVSISALLIVYFSLIGHIKSNKLYFRELGDSKIKGYLELIFSTYGFFIYIYWILMPYLLINWRFLEFGTLFVTLIISRGLFSPILDKYKEYTSNYEKIDFYCNSMNILKNGKNDLKKISKALDDLGFDNNSKSTEKNNFEQTASQNDLERINEILDVEKSRHNLNESSMAQIIQLVVLSLSILSKYTSCITWNNLINWVTFYLLRNSTYLSNVFIIMPFLILFFGITLNFNLISIVYLIISSFYCFSVLNVISYGLPEKESIFLKNGEIIKNGYILEDHPDKNYILVITNSKKIKVMKDSILKIESSLSSED